MLYYAILCSTFLGHMFRLYRQLSLIRKCYFYVWHVRLIYALNYYLLTYLNSKWLLVYAARLI